MKKKLVWFSALMGFSGLIWASPVQAIFLDFEPSVQVVPVGETAAVDVVISGLDAAGEIVSAFDLDVLYDDAILAATSVTFGSFLGDLDPLAFETIVDSDLSMSGVVDFAELSLLSDFELEGLQMGLDSFTLATLSFDTLAVGTSPLTFFIDESIGKDVKGRNAQVLDLTAGSGSISAVPEPGTLLLIGAGLVGMAGLKRKRPSKKRIAD